MIQTSTDQHHPHHCNCITCTHPTCCTCTTCCDNNSSDLDENELRECDPHDHQQHDVEYDDHGHTRNNESDINHCVIQTNNDNDVDCDDYIVEDVDDDDDSHYQCQEVDNTDNEKHHYQQRLDASSNFVDKRGD